MHRSALECFQGEFTEEKGWDPERRTAFLQRLHPIIRMNTFTAVGCSVIKADWDEVMPDDLKAMYAGPWGWAAQSVISGARKWCEIVGHDDPIEWVYEVGTANAKQIGDAFNALYDNPVWRQQWRISAPDGWSFKPKGVLPLQSADVVAYETFKEMENGILDGHRERPFRLSAADLFRAREAQFLQYWDKPRLQDWVRRFRERALARGV